MLDENEIILQLNTRVRRLKFSADIEHLFREFYYNRFLIERRFALALGLIVFLLSGLLDYYFVIDAIEKVVVLRYFIVSPIIIVCSCVVVVKQLSRYQQQSLAVMVICLGLTLVMIISLAPHSSSLLYFTGIILVLIFGCCLCFIRFRFALAVVGVIGLAYNLQMQLDSAYSLSTVSAHNYFYWGAGVLVLGCSYLMEANARATFLYEKLLKKREQGLKDANESLALQASKDGLTGIANRRHFDSKLANEWRRGIRDSHAVSLVMIDIDYFKKYNDSYGHQQGDICLQQIAKTIAEYAKRPGDLAARYGGEEFALILGGTDTVEAGRIANDLLGSIRRLAINHNDSDVASVVTVSAGLASIFPGGEKSPEQLIKQADQALYHAKGAGRDQVSISQ